MDTQSRKTLLRRFWRRERRDRGHGSVPALEKQQDSMATKRTLARTRGQNASVGEVQRVTRTDNLPTSLPNLPSKPPFQTSLPNLPSKPPFLPSNPPFQTSNLSPTGLFSAFMPISNFRISPSNSHLCVIFAIEDRTLQFFLAQYCALEGIPRTMQLLHEVLFKSQKISLRQSAVTF